MRRGAAKLYWALAVPVLLLSTPEGMRGQTQLPRLVAHSWWLTASQARAERLRAGRPPRRTECLFPSEAIRSRSLSAPGG